MNSIISGREKGRETGRETNGNITKPFLSTVQDPQTQSQPPDKPSSGKPKDLFHGLEYQWLMKILSEPILGFFY